MLQVRKTFEDLYAEAVRINEGRPSLAPYAEVGAGLACLDLAVAGSVCSCSAHPQWGADLACAIRPDGCCTELGWDGRVECQTVQHALKRCGNCMLVANPCL